MGVIRGDSLLGSKAVALVALLSLLLVTAKPIIMLCRLLISPFSTLGGNLVWLCGCISSMSPALGINVPFSNKISL